MDSRDQILSERKAERGLGYGSLEKSFEPFLVARDAVNAKRWGLWRLMAFIALKSQQRFAHFEPGFDSVNRPVKKLSNLSWLPSMIKRENCGAKFALQ